MAICLLLQRWGRLDPRGPAAQPARASWHGGRGDRLPRRSRPALHGRAGAANSRTSERPAVLFALGSQVTSRLRQLALDEAGGESDGERGAAHRSAEPPGRAPCDGDGHRLVDHRRARASAAFLPSPWMVALAALPAGRAHQPRSGSARQAMRLFSPEQRRWPPPCAASRRRTRSARALEDELRRWRESERFLFPILAFFEALGLPELADRGASGPDRGDQSLPARARRGGGALRRRSSSRAPTYTRLEQERDHLGARAEDDGRAGDPARARARRHLRERRIRGGEGEAGELREAHHGHQRDAAQGDAARQRARRGGRGRPGLPGRRCRSRIAATGARGPAPFWLLGEGRLGLRPRGRLVQRRRSAARCSGARRRGGRARAPEGRLRARDPRPWCVCRRPRCRRRRRTAR